MSLFDPGDDDDEPTDKDKNLIQLAGFILGIWWVLWFLSSRGYLG